MSKYTVQYIFQTYGDEYIKNHNLSKEQWKVYNAIRRCKTSILGYHKFTCSECGEEYYGKNSCRNRHCPMCQSYAREKWIDNENQYLLDCQYFHIITTVPHELNEIFMYNQKDCYNILFDSTSEAILELAKDPKWLGAEVGITSILHTWGQDMCNHPHIHSIVTGGGLSNNKWIDCKENYIFKAQVLSSLFKGKFLFKFKTLDLNLPEHLEYLKDLKELNKFLEPLYKKSWVAYIEPPKGSAENVVEYVGRYAFRVAISNDRIIDISNGNVTFEYKDYKDNGNVKQMTITCEEFIRRFLLHVLPDHFTKIRHYGLLSNRNKKNIIKFCRLLIGQLINNDFSSSKYERKLPTLKCEKCGCISFIYEYIYPNRPCNS